MREDVAVVSLLQARDRPWIPLAPGPVARRIRRAIALAARGAARGRGGDCRIKGNISRKGTGIYHVTGGALYAKTRIDTTKGERWFCSEAEARAAGWRRAKR